MPAKKQSVEKPVGVVTHFYGGIEVAVIKFKKDVRAGAKISIKGATTDFSQSLDSMQYDHAPVMVAKKGKEVGVKVTSKVREGDLVFEEK